MAQIACKGVQLFGGAMTTSVPQDYMDVSSIRQVPDNQEVYLKQNGFTSITFDILERVAQFNTDQEAMRFHLEDIVEGDDTIMIPESNVTIPSLPANVPVTSTFARTHETVNAEKQKVFTAIILMLIRLKEVGTDIVITINVPNVPDDYEPFFMSHLGEKEYQTKWAGSAIDEAMQMKAITAASFKIEDFGLFKP